MTKTETRRRLRAAVAACRQANPYIKSNYRVEVGHRINPLYTTTLPSHSDVYSQPGDDLEDFTTVAEAVGRIDRAGAVVHLYFSSTGDWGSLENVMVAWLGHGDEAPVCIDSNGRPV